MDVPASFLCRWTVSLLERLSGHSVGVERGSVDGTRRRHPGSLGHVLSSLSIHSPEGAWQSGLERRSCALSSAVLTLIQAYPVFTNLPLTSFPVFLLSLVLTGNLLIASLALPR